MNVFVYSYKNSLLLHKLLTFSDDKIIYDRKFLRKSEELGVQTFLSQYSYDMKNGTAVQLNLNENDAVYRMNIDGSNKSIVWECPDELCIYGLNYYIVSGNYIYSSYIYYYDMSVNPPKSYNSFANPKIQYDMMRINMLTGDVYYVFELK